jgi:hypothetical protein
MKRKFCFGVTVTALAWGASAATLPIYINDSPVFGPPAPLIDATIWVNRAPFNVFQTVPYDSLNTFFFTNGPSGIAMTGDPGFRFWHKIQNGQRTWMDTWVNEGTISTDNSLFLANFGFIVNNSTASILQVAATNILCTGPLSSGAHGLVRLEGDNITVGFTSLRTGTPPGGGLVIGGGFLGLSNYINDIGITDLYWGEGNGNAVANNRSVAMPVTDRGLATQPSFNPANPSSPFHDIIAPPFSGGIFSTQRTFLPGGSFSSGTNFFFNTNFFGTNISGAYGVAVHTNFLSATSSVVQVVFYPTNTGDPNFTTDVRFSSFGFGPATVVVGFHSLDFDIATLTTTDNSVYLLDDLATTTNVFLARNLNATARRRPSTYGVTRSTPFEYFNGVPGNSVYTPSLFASTNYTRTSATNRYAAYAANIALLGSSASGSIPYDPTNVPGRIEVLGNVVTLDQTRIRAETAFIIKATGNLTSNQVALVDAPLVNFDCRSIEPEMVISNLAPLTVRRMTGNIRAWSGVWDNFQSVTINTNTTTNTVTFHVLIVESQLRSLQPVTVNEFAARGANIVIKDVLNIGKFFLVEGDSLHITGGLNLPPGHPLRATNLINLQHFTNDGIINVSGLQNFGQDRGESYANYINRGTNIASTHVILADNFENTGTLVANGGVFLLDAVTARMAGAPALGTNFIFVGSNLVVVTVPSATARIQGSSEVRISAESLTVSNSAINAATLFMSVSGSLVDSGPSAPNYWSVTGGFNFDQLPAVSDLLGTYIRSTVPQGALRNHFWPAIDVGPTPAGFVNNLAVGKLTLDGGPNSQIRFLSATGNNAIYVDYLELLNSATDINALLSRIAPDFTIYFANANIPASRLDQAAGGRIRWVPGFAGPLSSTNITYPSGTTFTFNIALVTDQDLDSDGDGLVNFIDPTPILVSEAVVLTASLASAPPRCAMLSWRAPAYSSNTVEFKATADATQWKVLTNFVHGPYTTPVTVMDPVPTNGLSRVYRLRMIPAPYY